MNRDELAQRQASEREADWQQFSTGVAEEDLPELRKIWERLLWVAMIDFSHALQRLANEVLLSLTRKLP